MHRLTALLCAGLLASGPAFAHASGDAGEAGVERAFLIALIAALVAGAVFYAHGVAALWRKAGVGRGVRRAEAASFVAGWAVLAASLLSPIDSFADRSFALHMVQHELLMVVAAPLIVLGRPLEAWTWAASTAAQRWFAAAAKWPIVRTIGVLTMLPLGAWVLHALALWVWHLPPFFSAALRSPLLHILQHASFFGSALAYWWSVFGGRARRPKGSAIASLFTTMLHTSALGALLTFAPSPWYAGDEARAFGLSALEDQQLGGLIMWVPGGMAFMIAGLAIIGRWLAPARRTAKA